MDASQIEKLKALALAKNLRFFGHFASETEDQARVRRCKERNDAADALEALVAEVERLRADAGRYRWLREVRPDRLCTIAYLAPEACEFEDPDLAIDAAMKANIPRKVIA
jgi:hypothetical protein